MKYKTEQESFWAGDFGSQYISRNVSAEIIASNLAFFSRALSKTASIKNCIEFGANVGMNLRALALLFPNQEQHAIEINETAARELERIIPPENVFNESILEYSQDKKYDLVLIKGVCIHIHPESLNEVYDRLYIATGKYLLVGEYFNPTPVSIPYRGHEDRLFKRDFCREIMLRYPDLELIDYGFIYRYDPKFPDDDITWFLMEKK